MNNSIDGKTMGNLRKKKAKVRLVNNTKEYKKWLSRPTLVSQKIFSRNVIAFLEISPVLKLDKSICAGFSILNLSKWLIYDFHYSYVKSKHGCGAELLLTKRQRV